MNHYRLKAEGGHIGADIFGTPEPPPIELKIVVRPNGQIQITGPLTDKNLCLEILRSAADQITKADNSQLVSSN